MRIYYDRIKAFAFILGLLLVGAGHAYAGPYEDAMPGFTTDEFDDTINSVNAVVASGNPLPRN